jgi:hypothetical protein
LNGSRSGGTLAQSGKFAGFHALLPRFVVKGVDFRLQILLFVLQNAYANFDRFSLVSSIELDAAGG